VGRQGDLGPVAVRAGGAPVGSFSRVGPLVLQALGAHGEALPADVAAVGPLAGVDALVDHQVGGAGEAQAALGAAVGPLPGVELLVELQVEPASEALPALGAEVGLLRPPGREVGAVAEVLPTSGPPGGLLPGVGLPALAPAGPTARGLLVLLGAKRLLGALQGVLGRARRLRPRSRGRVLPGTPPPNPLLQPRPGAVRFSSPGTLLSVATVTC